MTSIVSVLFSLTETVWKNEKEALLYTGQLQQSLFLKSNYLVNSSLGIKCCITSL